MLDPEEKRRIRIRNNMLRIRNIAVKKEEGFLQKDGKTQLYTSEQCLGSAFIESESRFFPEPDQNLDPGFYGTQGLQREPLTLLNIK